MTDKTALTPSPLNGLRQTPELYVAATADGKKTPLRELKDEELLALSVIMEQQFSAARQNALQALDTSMAVSQNLAVIKFEMERRSKSIAIVHALPN